MDTKIIKSAHMINSGKQVTCYSTLHNKILQSVLHCAGVVQTIQGTRQITADTKGVNKIMRTHADIGNNLPINDIECDNVIISSLYNDIQNKKILYKEYGLLSDKSGDEKLTQEGLLSGYVALMSSLDETVIRLNEIKEAFQGRYERLQKEYGEKLYQEQLKKKLDKE